MGTVRICTYKVSVPDKMAYKCRYMVVVLTHLAIQHISSYCKRRVHVVMTRSLTEITGKLYLYEPNRASKRLRMNLINKKILFMPANSREAS